MKCSTIIPVATVQGGILEKQTQGYPCLEKSSPRSDTVPLLSTLQPRMGLVLRPHSVHHHRTVRRQMGVGGTYFLKAPPHYVTIYAPSINT